MALRSRGVGDSTPNNAAKTESKRILSLLVIRVIHGSFLGSTLAKKECVSGVDI